MQLMIQWAHREMEEKKAMERFCQKLHKIQHMELLRQGCCLGGPACLCWPIFHSGNGPGSLQPAESAVSPTESPDAALGRCMEMSMQLALALKTELKGHQRVYQITREKVNLCNRIFKLNQLRGFNFKLSKEA